MTTFTEALTGIIPDIRTGTAADVRSSLIGLARQLQQDPDSQAHSLQTWWQWLDDEGYDRETFTTILAQICKVRIGEQSLNELTSYIESSKDNADGIAILLEKVKQSHPSLLEEVETLESLALEEENQLGATAGGLGKGGKWGVGVGVVAAAGIAALIYKSTRNRPQALEHYAQIRIEEIDHEMVNERERFDSFVGRERPSFVVDHPEEIIKNLEAVNGSQRFKELKPIKDFSYFDISEKAANYVEAHYQKFEKQMKDKVEDRIWESYKSDEKGYNADLLRYDKENGDIIEKAAKDDGLSLGEALDRRWDFNAVQGLRNAYNGSIQYEINLANWGVDKELEIQEEVKMLTTNDYETLLQIEKSYKEDKELFMWAKNFSHADGFALTEVDKGIEHADIFMLDITKDIDKKAKMAVQEKLRGAEYYAEDKKQKAYDEAKIAAEREERRLEIEERDLLDTFEDFFVR
jgi:hypothetical protein